MLIRFFLLPASIVAALAAIVSAASAAERPPNFVLIFTDDQGYADLGCFGGSHVETPHIDRLAVAGIRLTSFYVPAPYCTASRAGLLTGCYPRRVGLEWGSNFPVLLAGDAHGLNADEITLAELLHERGYATAIFGKWHLGDQPQFLPTRHGFDTFYGIPYSHDIHPFHPGQGKRFDFPPLPLLENEKVIAADPNADNFTRDFTERAIQFIEANKDRPFFAYLPHPIPHLPYHVSEEFKKNLADEQRRQIEEQNISYARSRNFLRPACIREIDWSVGQIVTALKRLKLDKKTLVIFTCDNGAALGYGGSNAPLRGGKGSCYEGGMRVPFVASWPSTIPPGATSDELTTALDILPTFAALAGAQPPVDRQIDGHDIWPILSGKLGATSPYEAFVYYSGRRRIEAVRAGPWKLVLYDKGNRPALYNLDDDIGEKKNVAADHPDIVAELQKHVARFRTDLGEGKQPGPGARPCGKVANPQPLTKAKDSERG